VTEPREVRGVRELEEFLARAEVDAAVSALRPDYRALLIAMDGLTPSSDAVQVAATDATAGSATEELLAGADAAAANLLAETPLDEVPHVAAWQEAYRAFGANLNAPATASRPSCVARARGCRG
jgi:hypothetical protein